MNSSFLTIEIITLPQAMIAIAVGMAIGWGGILEISKNYLYDTFLPNTYWWQRAIQPTTSMMHNVGYPQKATKRFPEAVSEPMARDFYAFIATAGVQHFLSAIFMIPVVAFGWENVSEYTRCLFVLGTLSDVGFDIYDAYKSTLRTFTKHSALLPLNFWVFAVALHHTLALSLVIPMNAKYIHLEAYHKTVLSLLMGASFCCLAGCYKLALDVKQRMGFYTYKLIVLFRLFVILYTRVYLWFAGVYVILTHFAQVNDALFFRGGCVMGFVFSVFNLLLVPDAVNAVLKWLPRKMDCSDSSTNKAQEQWPASHTRAPFLPPS